MAAEADRTDPNLGSRETRIALNETRFREINDRLAPGSGQSLTILSAVNLGFTDGADGVR